MLLAARTTAARSVTPSSNSVRRGCIASRSATSFRSGTMTQSTPDNGEMSTATLASKALSGDFSAFPGGWMLEKLSQIEVFGKRDAGLSMAHLLDIEKIGGVGVMNQAPRLASNVVAGQPSLLKRQVPSS